MAHEMNTIPGEFRPLRHASIIGYGLGDMANNFVFSMGLLYLLNYYTDVVGLSAAAAGSLLSVSRIHSAIMDIVAGQVIDRSKISWGNFRPFILLGGPPLLLMSIAVFSVPPDFGPEGKLVYACTSCFLLVTIYSFVNIPYGSLACVMTQAPGERSLLGVSRNFMAAITVSFLAFVLGDLLHPAHGAEFQAMLKRFTLILAAVGSVLYVICFKSSREIVPRKHFYPTWKKSMKTLCRNRPLLILSLAAIFMLCGSFSMNASMIFYARYVLGDPKQFSALMLTTILFGTLVSAPLIPFMTPRIGKKGVFLSGAAIGALSYLIIFLFPSLESLYFYLFIGLGSIGMMTAMTIMWALQSDTVEYGEWLSGVRHEGFFYSAFSFARKIGQAIGGSIPAFILAMSDYAPNALIQSDNSLTAIRLSTMLVPTLALGCAFFTMLLYPLSDPRFLAILREMKYPPPPASSPSPEP